MLKVKVGLSRAAVVLLLTGSLAGTSVIVKAQGRSAANAIPAAANSRDAAAHTIVWNGTTELRSQAHPKALNFDGATFTADGLPVFFLNIPGKALDKIQLTNTTYEPLTAAEAALVTSAYKATQPEITSEIGLEMGNPVTVVYFVPIRINPATGQKEKLVSFSYTSQPARNVPQARGSVNNQFSDNSVLSSGTAFYKMAVTASGMYKVDRKFLSDLGLNPDQVDPNMLQVYGNGGGMLPQLNSAPRPNDLFQNPVMVSHNGNAVFEEGEYLIFYAQGPHTWKVSADKDLFQHIQNIYSDTAYYFITAGSTPGRRVSARASLPASGPLLTYSDERAFHETDAENFLKSGRQWFGEKFSSFSPSRDFSFPATGLKPGTTAKIAVSVLNAAPSASTFQITLNGAALGTISVGAAISGGYGAVGRRGGRLYTKDFPSPPADFSIRITYSGGSSSTQGGYLDFLELNYQRQLRLTDNQLAFRRRLNLGAQNTGTFKLSNTTPNTIIWDVTNPRFPVAQQGSNSNGEFSFTTDSLAVREFIAFDGSDFPKPAAAGRVAPQNLHALNLNGDLDLVIVAHPKFMASAEQLARHRRTNDGLQVAIVTTFQVYNEFSSGAQDITAIRDMMRMVYNRRASGKRINLLLFGDASYDYKYRKSQNTNYVPIYESRDEGDLDNLSTYSSDDYYGFLDDSEGEWPDNFSNHKLDIGIGRLPVNRAEDAQAVVKKLIDYDSPTTFGKWRNSVIMVADDGNGNVHLNHADTIGDEFELQNSNVNQKKIYLDAYQQISVASGQRSPQMQDQLNRAVEQGALIVNFSGHGSETGWLHERVLEVPQIQKWNNAGKLAFFVTATCEFGRYDDPDRNSGGEYILTSPNGAGIGLLTTTRPVFTNHNLTLNLAFARCVYTPVDGKMPRLGDVLRITKNNSTVGSANRNFALLGDPSARLAYPEQNIRINKVNSEPTTPLSQDTLRALSVVTIEGDIVDAGNNVLTGFNEQLQATVFEKPTTIPTFGDEPDGSPTQFQVRQNVIYDGLATVSNGTFKFQFVVPKDINYSFGFGKISLYSNSLTTDAAGNHSRIVIGGTDPNAASDNTPPDADLFMNDESFVFGGTTGKEATFLAKLYDESGINTAGIGIGHELKMTLDEGEEFIVNEYYTADVNSYKSGTIRFPLKDLETGPHSIKLKVWDSHNNSRDEYLEFIVVNDASLALSHVLNYPNPFSQQTTFHFDHNRAGDPLEIQVQVFTVSGKLVKTISQQANETFSRSHVKSLTWDGRDDFNDKLAKGVYVYKVSVRSLRDGSKAHQYQKLVILN